MKTCSYYDFCKEFHKEREGGFICFNPLHCLNNMCEYYKGSKDRVKPQPIHINVEDMEKQMRETRQHKKEFKKRMRKKYLKK